MHSNSMYDAKALELSARVMELFEAPLPIGGAVQLQARIQNLFIDAMRFANPRHMPAIPYGFQVVPKKPTSCMLINVVAQKPCPPELALEVYRLMLAGAEMEQREVLR